MRRVILSFGVALASTVVAVVCPAAEPGGVQEPRRKALIVDGQNNHANWPQTTRMMKQYLEESGRFTVDVVTHAPKGPDPSFAPSFEDYAVVVSNFGHGAAPWADETKAAFEAFVRGGGGFVAVHAADNSFPEWPAYNGMIGLGGWGGRTEKSGPYVYFTDDGSLVRDTKPGPGGSHGPQSPFAIQIRVADHPITKGMPVLVTGRLRSREVERPCGDHAHMVRYHDIEATAVGPDLARGIANFTRVKRDAVVESEARAVADALAAGAELGIADDVELVAVDEPSQSAA